VKAFSVTSSSGNCISLFPPSDTANSFTVNREKQTLYQVNREKQTLYQVNREKQTLYQVNREKQTLYMIQAGLRDYIVLLTQN